MKNINKKDFAQDIPENIKEVTLKALSFYPKLKDIRIEFVFNENIRKSVMQAPVERVYKTMLEDETYRKWTSVFNPGSHYIGSWEKGAKILFIGTDDSGAQDGMDRRISENIPNKFVSIAHIGIVGSNGEEIISGPKVEGQAGALENYSFESDNGTTLLSVDLDSNQQFKSYFEETYPLALEKLKEICED